MVLLNVDWNAVEYTVKSETDKSLWEAEWVLDPPSQGGKIHAKDFKGTIIYSPVCSPYNEDERRLAKLFLHSREMLVMLTRVANKLCHDKQSQYVSLVMEMDKLLVAAGALDKKEQP